MRVGYARFIARLGSARVVGSRFGPDLIPTVHRPRNPGERPTKTITPRPPPRRLQPTMPGCSIKHCGEGPTETAIGHTAGIRAVALLISGDPAQTSTIVDHIADQASTCSSRPQAPGRTCLPAAYTSIWSCCPPPHRTCPALQELQGLLRSLHPHTRQTNNGPRGEPRCRALAARSHTTSPSTDPTQIVLCAEALIATTGAHQATGVTIGSSPSTPPPHRPLRRPTHPPVLHRIQTARGTSPPTPAHHRPGAS